VQTNKLCLYFSVHVNEVNLEFRMDVRLSILPLVNPIFPQRHIYSTAKNRKFNINIIHPAGSVQVLFMVICMIVEALSFTFVYLLPQRKPLLTLLFAFLTALLISLFSIPSIIGVSNKLELFDEPGERKMHTSKIPFLGGLAIFAATLISFIIWAIPYFEQNQLIILASLCILFFMGLRDDILPIKPVIKILGQMAAAFLVISFCGLYISGLHGLFGIHTVSPVIAYVISTLVILFLINSFNLIDGLDGLAAGLAFIAALSFTYLFFCYEEYFMAVLSCSLAGALLGFLVYNFYPAKIFMGDTGSLTVGFILSILAIRFVELNKATVVEDLFNQRSAPVIVLAILIIPVVDAIRVFFLRLYKKRSPFSADRLHIHHKLLDLGFSERQVALVLYIVNLLYIFLAWFFRFEDSTFMFYVLIISALVMTQLPHLILKLRNARQFK